MTSARDFIEQHWGDLLSLYLLHFLWLLNIFGVLSMNLGTVPRMHR